MSYHLFFNNTIIVQVRYSTIETKEAARVSFFAHSYSGEGLVSTYLGLHLRSYGEKETRYYSIQTASFVSIVMYPLHTEEEKYILLLNN